MKSYVKPEAEIIDVQLSKYCDDNEAFPILSFFTDILPDDGTSSDSMKQGSYIDPFE